jgi:hypothetical protein
VKANRLFWKNSPWRAIHGGLFEKWLFAFIILHETPWAQRAMYGGGARTVPNEAWKRTERAVAKRLGGKRVGNTGRATADVLTLWLAIEVKSKRKLPAWLSAALGQARAAAGDTRLGVVVLHQHGERHSDDIVLMRLADFEDWFGEIAAQISTDDEEAGAGLGSAGA